MKLLLVGDERKNRRMIAWGFTAEPYRVKMASSRAALADLLETHEFQIACVDLRMQEDDALALIDYLHEKLALLPLVTLLGENDKRLIATLRQRGVAAQLMSPFPIASLHATLRTHALAQPIGLAKRPKDAPAAPAGAPRLMTTDDASRRTLELALRAANSNAAILILGETGTGKTVLAQTIHRHSPLRDRPFVTVNCPCLNHELLESDLFGHVRGSFTGAVQDTWGKVAAAEGGTLFLDEIGDLPMAIQPKLLNTDGGKDNIQVKINKVISSKEVTHITYHIDAGGAH